jgi:purine-binding chemotaxis protein CheW
MSSPESQRGAKGAREIVVFRLDELVCGLDLRQIQEISRIHSFTPVHRAPGYVRGLVNMRGQIITLVDLRTRLELPPRPWRRGAPAIIVPLERELVGLLVDDVDDVLGVDEEAIRPPPANLHGVAGRFFTAVLQTPSGLVALVDKDRLAGLDDAGPLAAAAGGR